MSLMSIAVTLHVIAVVLWVGGMFFAHQCLRPVAASQLEPPQRLPLWVGVFGRFFPWVWVAVIVVLATGLWMILGHFGGFAAVRPYVHTMFLLGIIMMLIFMHVFFAPYKKLKRAVAAQDWPAGAKSLNQIRMLVGINTVIGVITIAVGSAGRYIA
ncbi:MAG: CopD family protein [Gammaproteobacteria bacterium]